MHAISLPYFLGLAWLVLPAATRAEPGNAAVGRHMLIASYSPKKQLIEMSPDGKILWEHPFPGLSVMFRALPEGHVVYAFAGKETGVQEVDRNHQVVWQYLSTSKEVIGFDRLANGNTLIGEQGPCRALEVDPNGRTVRAIDLQTAEERPHRQVRSVHKLPNENILAAHEGEGAVREYSASGKVVWAYAGVPNVFEAIRMDNGNTLISTSGRIIEVTQAGQTRWELRAQDVPEVALTWPTSIQRLANGNLLIADFKVAAQGKGAHAFEVTRDKKVVWTYADHSLVKVLSNVHLFGDDTRTRR
jgi:hypothetical protein